MTPPDTLDRRGREAAHAARESVTLLRPPGIEPRSGRTRLLVLGGLVAATLLLIAGTVSSTRSCSSTTARPAPSPSHPPNRDPAPDTDGETLPDTGEAAPAGVMPRLEVVPPRATL